MFHVYSWSNCSRILVVFTSVYWFVYSRHGFVITREESVSTLTESTEGWFLDSEAEKSLEKQGKKSRGHEGPHWQPRIVKCLRMSLKRFRNNLCVVFLKEEQLLHCSFQCYWPPLKKIWFYFLKQELQAHSSCISLWNTFQPYCSVYILFWIKICKFVNFQWQTLT